MQLTILIFLVVTRDYADKIVMLLVLEYVLVATSRSEDVVILSLIINIIHRYNNKENKIFNFWKKSYNALEFKSIRRDEYDSYIKTF